MTRSDSVCAICFEEWNDDMVTCDQRSDHKLHRLCYYDQISNSHDSSCLFQCGGHYRYDYDETRCEIAIYYVFATLCYLLRFITTVANGLFIVIGLLCIICGFLSQNLIRGVAVMLNSAYTRCTRHPRPLLHIVKRPNINIHVGG